MDRKKTLLVCCAVLISGAALTGLIFLTEPTAQRTGAVKETAMLVDVTSVERGTFTPTIRAMGTVVPSQDVVLSPRVGGEVVARSPAFTPGGYVRQGETLLQIDPADYENALRQRRTALDLAISDLNIEMGRQAVARQDYELLDDTLSGENQSLVLRGPQLAAVRARVEAAEAAVEQAELQLQRTTIRAPFDSHILSRNVNVGSQVAPGDDLGRLVGLETYWIEATVPVSALRWLQVPDGGEAGGSQVTIRNRTAWPEGQVRQGQLYRLVGSLEGGTRLARVIIAVPDPHAFRPENAGAPALMIGAFVEATIQADEISDVIRLNRDYVRSNETVWVMEEGRLSIRDVDIAFTDPTYAYIGRGLDDSDRIVTTNLTTVADSARLRVDPSAGEEPDFLPNATH